MKFVKTPERKWPAGVSRVRLGENPERREKTLQVQKGKLIN